MGDKLAEVEEKYDLNAGAEGFGEEGEEGESDFADDAGTEEDEAAF
ncbi:hypothetical protein FHL01_13575 [Cylindrospermopsis raciborskii CS-506_C]|nr:hypothetical protein [Cylindrospermopsis raciborskii CS-506_C]